MAFTPKPPTSVRSIRLPDETWDWLGEEAGRRGVSVNGLVSDFIAVARLKVAEAKAAPRETPRTRAAPSAPTVHVAVPTFERKAFNPRPKPGKRP